jgi:hypothetical protein
LIIIGFSVSVIDAGLLRQLQPSGREPKDCLVG